uniref:Uncharacterized protein n=1 Tax=Anguilla anguilla TaxID=7936 RepID=A0A0E9QXR9_ANGAN
MTLYNFGHQWSRENGLG